MKGRTVSTPTITKPGYHLVTITDAITGLDSVYATRTGGEVVAGIVGVNIPDEHGKPVATWYLMVCGTRLPVLPGFTSQAAATEWMNYLADLNTCSAAVPV